MLVFSLYSYNLGANVRSPPHPPFLTCSPNILGNKSLALVSENFLLSSCCVPGTSVHNGIGYSLTILNCEYLLVSTGRGDIYHACFIIICRMLTQYIKALSMFAKAFPPHRYSAEMGKVIVLDVLMKNETCREDTMHCIQNYFWSE